MTAGAATIVDPATEDVVGVVLHTTADEVDTAIARAPGRGTPGPSRPGTGR